MDCSPPGSSVHGISQAEYWSGWPFPSPGDLPNPGIKPMSPALADRFFTTEPPRKSRLRLERERDPTSFSFPRVFLLVFVFGSGVHRLPSHHCSISGQDQRLAPGVQSHANLRSASFGVAEDEALSPSLHSFLLCNEKFGIDDLRLSSL